MPFLLAAIVIGLIVGGGTAAVVSRHKDKLAAPSTALTAISGQLKLNKSGPGQGGGGGTYGGNVVLPPEARTVFGGLGSVVSGIARSAAAAISASGVSYGGNPNIIQASSTPASPSYIAAQIASGQTNTQPGAGIPGVQALTGGGDIFVPAAAPGRL